MRKTLRFLLTAIVISFAGVGTASAGSITCPGTAAVTDREATFDSALSCGWGEGNPGQAEVEAFAGGVDPWMMIAELEEDAGSGVFSDGPLTIDITTGAWGDKVVGGTWSLPNDFWDNHSRAIVSIHVGGGRQENSPDYWLFEIDPGTDAAPLTAGTWHIDGSCCNGGGLSNFKLWKVPEPGTLLLLGAGLIGMGVRRRRMA